MPEVRSWRVRVASVPGLGGSFPRFNKRCILSCDPKGGDAVTVWLAREKAARLVNKQGQSCLPLAMLLLAGCAAKPPPPPLPPTLVTVQISSTNNANATPDGQGAPVAIRIYQLASKSAFDGAEFFALYKADATTLGPDLVKKDEFLIVPGGNQSTNLTPADPVHAIGVFAAYRDFQTASWRASADIPAHETTTISVTADSGGIKLTAKSVKPASP
jgi:type VI secretion system protein VasD